MNATGLSKRQQLALSQERAAARRQESGGEAVIPKAVVAVPNSRAHHEALCAMGVTGAYADLSEVRAEAAAREPRLLRRKAKAQKPGVYSVDETALVEDLVAHARMGDAGAAYHVLNRGKAKTDSQLRKGLLGLVVPNSEMPKVVQQVALPWAALHQATEIINDIRDPDARLAGLYFMARAHKVTCDELAERVGNNRDQASKLAAEHVKLFCTVAAKALRPVDFSEDDRRMPFRADAKPRGEFIVGVAGQLRQAFAVTHSGKIAKGVDAAFEQLQDVRDNAIAALLNPKEAAQGGPA